MDPPLPPQRRSNSFPLPSQSPNREEKDKGKLPTRSTSLTARLSPRSTGPTFRPNPIEESTLDKNAAVVKSTALTRRKAHEQAHLRAAEAEFTYFETAARLLRTAYASREAEYDALRTAWAAGCGAHWTRGQWVEFLRLDELMEALRGEMFAAEARMEEREAFMCLFREEMSPEAGVGTWSVQGDVRVWSLRGEEVEGDVVLEWKGVDYGDVTGLKVCAEDGVVVLDHLGGL